MTNSSEFELTELRTEVEGVADGPFREAMFQMFEALDCESGPGKAEAVRAAAERLGKVVYEELVAPAEPAGGDL